MARHPWVDEFAFIVAEAQRIQGMDLKDFISTDPNGGWHSVPAHDGGFLLIGSEAGERLEKVAADYLSRQKDLNGRISLDALVKSIKNRFSRTFLEKEAAVNHAAVMSFLHKSAMDAAKSIEDLTHYIPCHIVSSENPEQFSIGCVRFIRKNRFDIELGGDLDRFRQSVAGDREVKYPSLPQYKDANDEIIKENADKFASSFTEAIEEYFGEFDWVAEVKITNCDPQVARWRAQQATNLALDAIRLFMKPGYADRMRVGGHPDAHPKAAKLVKLSNGDLDISYTHGSHGEPVGDDWWESITSKEHQRNRFHIIGNAINTVANPGPTFPLTQRFLDALGWFGSGCKDNQPASKLIKFVTSIERMVLIPDERDEITKKVVSRGASHAYDCDDRNLDHWTDVLNSVYDCRSKLVHGAISPYDPRVFEYWPIASKACQFILMRGLDFFDYLGLDAPEVSHRKLRQAYDTLVANSLSLNKGGPAERIQPFK